MEARRHRAAQPRRARAARRHRQLVRAAPGQALRRRLRRVGDGVELRPEVRGRAHHREFLRLHPDEHPMAVQLFGHDAEVMRIAAGMVAEAGADADRPQLRLPRAQGLQDGRRRRAARRSRQGRSRSPRRRARAAACRSPSSCAPATARVSAPASSWRAAWWRRPGWRASPASAPRVAAAQGRARLRARGRVGASSCPCPVVLSGGLRDEERTSRPSSGRARRR